VADPGPIARSPDRPGPGPLPETLLRALDLTIRRRVEGMLAGDHRSALLGSGSELAQVRAYVEGCAFPANKEDVIRAARIVHERHPEAHVVLIGGPDAFMPGYADELRGLVRELQLERVVRFLGDRPDVPRLLSGLDILVWLSRGEGMPHVISEAGAARLPVVATRDGGTEEQIDDGVSGLFVPHECPEAVAAALDRLIGDADLRRCLGNNLRRKVEQELSAEVVTQRWQALFDEVIAEGPR